MSEETTRRIEAALGEPFAADKVHWRAGSTNKDKTKAMALAYLDARDVQDRLDLVLGVANWQDDYEFRDNGSVYCRLSVRLCGEWIAKCDVGSPSEQPDEHDQVKACVSDALKRAAVKWGVGRYLYRLGPQWVKYDAQRKTLAERPQLPPWALPLPIKPPPPSRPEPEAAHQPRPHQPKPEKPQPVRGTVTDEQLATLKQLVTVCAYTLPQLKADCGIANPVELSAEDADRLIEHLQARAEEIAREASSQFADAPA